VAGPLRKLSALWPKEWIFGALRLFKEALPAHPVPPFLLYSRGGYFQAEEQVI